MNKMGYKDYILSCIGEECGEIQQVVGKTFRFGLDDINPKTGASNEEELFKEIHDLIAVYEMFLNSKDSVFGDSFQISRKMINEKKSKVLKYMEYSKKKNRLGD